MESLDDIVREIMSCRKCDLHKTKTNYVPGVGNEKAEIVFVGEAPGRDEDLKGEPFVGAAGKLLTEMLASIGLRREDVYITNVLKCRPPNNRDPTPEEVEKCGNYLVRQLEAIRPNVIVCLGRFAAQFIFNLFDLEFTTISRVKGKVYEVERWGKKVKVIAIYHPAAVLYRPQLREEYESDFKKIGELCGKKQPTLFDYL
ncbi:MULTISPECIES: type-4 uracil-DNA glycosylase [Archaeoglobus]|uniref:Type-4 uracil-DNA glycosylase n=1 Tax=Archaeoglobus fulgidus DSM 8774 TaxID=1344584 RepID=A0A075WHL4_ARCFL|nr:MULTISPECIES: type-4 uracil-DNA glycosylase [Archaeoglobus]AIG99287.1 uracil-DNA glycosylase, family 4 [Archaeoglobus fulgidus DSM 8774]MDI3497026.1 uracil-DNA glycosylase [Archaeoglobus sp.]